MIKAEKLSQIKGDCRYDNKYMDGALKQKGDTARRWWLTLIILATQETEIRRIAV
jgi:hypothetical protein